MVTVGIALIRNHWNDSLKETCRMVDFSSKTVCVVDSGIYVSTALRLARDFGKVYYFSPWIMASPHFAYRAPGMGFKEIERVDYLWDIKNKVDLFVFPWIFFHDIQQELESQGKRVWGARRGEILELHRPTFKAECAKAGLPVAQWEEVKGLDALTKALKEYDDVWIKTDPNIRGDGETWHSENFDLSQPKLLELRHRFGPMANTIDFVIEQCIPDATEDGYDGYAVDGQWPDHGFEGLEIKDCGTALAYKPNDELSAVIRESNEAMSEFMAKHRYRGFWGTEVRKDDEAGYFNDPTTRLSFPPGQAVEEMLENLAEILWFGAQGELVEPQCRWKFGIQCQIYSDFPGWQPYQIDPKVERWVKVVYACSDGEQVYAVPDLITIGEPDPVIGSVIGVGNTVEEAIKHVKKNCEGFKSYKANPRLDAIPKAFSELEKGKERGITFTSEAIPDAAALSKLLS